MALFCYKNNYIHKCLTALKIRLFFKDNPKIYYHMSAILNYISKVIFLRRFMGKTIEKVLIRRDGILTFKLVSWAVR